MEEVIDAHRFVMDECDPHRKLKMVVDEWGNWHKDGSGPSKGYNLFEQQSNLRDAAVAALTLNIFNNRCDVVGMANLAQLCNNLHSLYLAAGENFVETPNYHVFAMYKNHQGGKQLETTVTARILDHEKLPPLNTLSASASVKDGVTTVTLANLSCDAPVELVIEGMTAQSATGRMLHGRMDQYNDFDNAPLAVEKLDGIAVADGKVTVTLPPCTVAALELR